MSEQKFLTSQLRQFFRKTLGRKRNTQRQSDEGENFVANAASDMLSQIQYEADLRAARGNEPLSVRLVPQVPVRDVDAAAGWIGGGACLPIGTSWPILDSPTQLLAQINCGKLPEDLWQGLGPREGWLAIFLDPVSFKLTALHFDQAGPFVPSPEVDQECYILGIDHSRRAPNRTWRFTRWPVDIVPVRLGQDDPHLYGRCKITNERYKERHDIVEKHRLPFDWPSTQTMIDKALSFVESMIATGDLPDHLKPESIEAMKRRVEQAKKNGDPIDEIAKMTFDYENHFALIESFKFRSENGPKVVKKLKAIKSEVDKMALSGDFSQEKISQFTTELSQLTWMYVKTPPWTISHVERMKEGVKVFELPLTTHDPKASPNWIYSFESELLDAAKAPYFQQDEQLPDALISDCEEVWAAQARHEMGGMGHTPWGYVHQFNSRQEVTLLELPSSDLIGWMFGDVNNLVITIKKRDLKRGDFSNLSVQVTN
ncbi:DUF1963 domain-containing protein [Ruegeria arenilitoris]|uniref:DUF1963 domain-containing protein n=1 Tax=Ruegeria arenilitoris TaxID=1173585 RepID=UPI00147D9769